MPYLSGSLCRCVGRADVGGLGGVAALFGNFEGVLKMMICCSGKLSGLKKRLISRLCHFMCEHGIPV